MKWIKVAAVVVFLNLAAIDLAAWRVDRELIRGRDAVCEDMADARPNSYELMRIEFIDSRTGHPRWSQTLHFYGCDVNGKTYRMWLQR